MDYFKLACEIAKNQSGGLRPAPAAHTPGPWAIDKRVIVYAVDGDVATQDERDPTLYHHSHLIALCYAPRGTDLYDNARLIAAAPDLLSALQLALTEEGEGYHIAACPGVYACNCWAGRARAAIRKATEGEK